jgi:dihydroneopterin aldolase
LGVEIERSRDGFVSADQDNVAVPHPRVMFLSNAAIHSDHLTGWIDQAANMDAPLVLCVGAGELAVAQTGHAMTQRRINLLAIEQNAWVLAAKDHRCKVVETRTELDWAMKNGQVCVWAPSKIVLDAVDGPAAGLNDALSLVSWFAAEMSALELMVIGEDGPDSAVPMQVFSTSKAKLS